MSFKWTDELFIALVENYKLYGNQTTKIVNTGTQNICCDSTVEKIWSNVQRSETKDKNIGQFPVEGLV